MRTQAERAKKVRKAIGMIAGGAILLVNKCFTVVSRKKKKRMEFY